MENKTNRWLLVIIIVLLLLLAGYYMFVKRSTTDMGPGAGFTPPISNQPGTSTTTTPTATPGSQPTSQPSSQPTSLPTSQPSSQPTDSPKTTPTQIPTSSPSSLPSSQPTPTPPQGPVVVTVSDSGYSPANLTVSKGTTIRFVNSGSINHSATGDKGEFDTDRLVPGQTSLQDTGSWSVGLHPYHCQFHPNLKGMIIVQ